jgi:GNAT superfamily N-acetyltransferase
MTTVYRAGLEHLPQLVTLFDKYRIFYGQDSDIIASENFLRERLANNEAIVFMAEIEGEAMGFTQLYTSFSSVSMQPIYILNDLYVEAAHRKKGIGEALLNRAKELCRESGFKGLALETEIDNPAQKLYERLGWEKDSACFHYFWSVQ